MGLQDVADTFPSLPVQARYWAFMLICWYDLRDLPTDIEFDPDKLYLYVTTCGDFGVKSMPWTWTKWMNIFLRCCKEQGAELPQSAYLDDLTRICKTRDDCNREMDITGRELERWGLAEKKLKRQYAAQQVQALGAEFKTVPLPCVRLPTAKAEDMRRQSEQLRDSAKVSKGVLRSYVGFALHCLQMLPRWLRVHMGGVFALNRGFTDEQHHSARRRVTSGAREGFAFFAAYLRRCTGKWQRVYNRHHPRPTAPDLYTDAAGGRRAGGGYWSCDGQHTAWRYGRRTSRRMIAWLEMDAVRRAVGDLAAGWAGCQVRLFVDNRTAVGALRKGWSRSAQLQELLLDIGMMAAVHDFEWEVHWLPSKENVLADALSRGDHARFAQARASLYA
jgi:hypothetical protein